MQQQDDGATSPSWYQALIDWIRRAGGHVHESLVLMEQDGIRGIGCSNDISKDELLIRLPSSLALSGQHMPSTYRQNEGNNVSKHASPWLKCLAAFYQEKSSKETSSYRPYLDSLPDQYEHLIEWSNAEVEEYLKGTTIGSIVQADRSNGTLEERYRNSVCPYLEQHCKNPNPQENDKQEEERFRDCCMCISTRGFHLQPTFDNTTDNQEAETKYSGPFLLPFIDLLNHNPALASTTLKRNDETDSFYMIAERKLEKGEQVFHSYGTSMSSAQVLQTFGFVPNESIQRATTWTATKGLTMADANDVTCAILAKQDVVKACCELRDSLYPKQLEEYIKKHCPEEETWNLSSTLAHRQIDNLIPNEQLVVSYSDTPLSNELVTLCTLLLLSDETYQEFTSDDSPALLDSSVLDDYFLGKLSCHCLLNVIESKKQQYGNTTTSSNVNELGRLKSDDNKLTVTEQRAIYGLTIRIEEMACLEKLRKQVLELMDRLDDNGDDCDGDTVGNDETNGKRKREDSGE